MLCAYSWYAWCIIISMIVTGAARSVVVKLAYQSGFEAPLTITLLYFLGQSLSLGIYWIQNKTSNGMFWKVPFQRKRGRGQSHQVGQYPPPGGEEEDQIFQEEKIAKELETKRISVSLDSDPLGNGSSHGLSQKSIIATQWTERIPWYYKPVIPGFFSLLNSTLRWLSLVYVAASVAEMLITGLELALSVVAARAIRKREISNTRWMGVCVVSIGVIVVSFANYHNKTAAAVAVTNEVYDDDGMNIYDYNGNASGDDEIDVAQKNYITGIVLIVLQCIFSVLQDLAEEVFMQASDFPPTLLLGMEGMFGLIFGLLIYICFGEKLGEDPMATIAILQEDPYMSAWLVGLPFLFLVTGIFNIKATEVTSSMTRNVWKNLRTLLVWIAALCIFYMSGNSDIGEAWLMPGSFYTLVGFMTMSGGIVVYYWHKKIEIEATDAMPLQRTDHEVL
uniref:EamA domain-containing protein n=1 Tax=Chaetoceros debilis TaxID=122233 RepID=A0A7S3Q1R4_9STRA